MNDMPTITITIEEYMHLRACENKCNAEGCRENDIDVHFIESNDKDYPTIPMALVPFKENYNLISLRVGDTKPLTVVPLSQVLDAISYPKADYIVIDGVKCCPTCRKPVYPKNDKPSEKWIPVSERLPEEKVNPITMDFYEYPCTVKFGDVYDVRYYKFGRGKWWHGAGTIDNEVIAWQPLPKPFDPQDSEVKE